MKTNYTPEFESFWNKYPKRWVESSGSWVKIGKYEAFQAWKRLAKSEREIIMMVLPKVKANKFTPDAHRWLKKRRWEDFEIKNSRKKMPIFRRESQKDSELVQSDKVREQVNRLATSLTKCD